MGCIEAEGVWCVWLKEIGSGKGEGGLSAYIVCIMHNNDDLCINLGQQVWIASNL